jgi:hypothetical protein
VEIRPTAHRFLYREVQMNRKLSKTCALITALACSSLVLAQEGSTCPCDLITDFPSILGLLAALIWFILFTSWGGFRWLY